MSTKSCSFTVRDRYSFDIIIDPGLSTADLMSRTGIAIVDRGFDCLFPDRTWGQYPAGSPFIKRLHLVRFADPLAGRHLAAALGSIGLTASHRLVDLLCLAGQHVFATWPLGTILVLASGRRGDGLAAALFSGQLARAAASARILSIARTELIQAHAHVLAVAAGDGIL